MTTTELFKRYEIEPRAKSGGGWGCQAWLVIYDKVAKDYIRASDHPRAYKKFKNASEAVRFLAG